MKDRLDRERPCCVTTLLRSAVYMTKSRGPRTEPCGTTYRTVITGDRWPSSDICWVLPQTKDVNRHTVLSLDLLFGQDRWTVEKRCIINWKTLRQSKKTRRSYSVLQARIVNSDALIRPTTPPSHRAYVQTYRPGQTNEDSYIIYSAIVMSWITVKNMPPTLADFDICWWRFYSSTL